MFQRKDFKKLQYLEGNTKKNSKVFKVENIHTKKIYALKEVEVSVGMEEYLKLNLFKEEAIQLTKAKNHKNVVQFYGYYFYKNTDRNKYKMGLIYEYLDSEKNLENIFRTREKDSHFFKEDELSIIYSSLIDAMAYLEANGIKHENIKLSNLFLTEEGEVKIIGLGQSFEQVNDSNSNVNYIRNTSPQYLSPVLWKSYVFTHKNIVHDPIKSDVFSAGLVLFQLSSLRDITGFNQKTLYNDGENLIQISLNKLRRKYSHRLIDILTKMLIYEEENRPTFIELNKLIKGLLIIVEEDIKDQNEVKINFKEEKKVDQENLFKRYKKDKNLIFNMKKKTYWFEFGGNMIGEYDFNKKEKKWELLGKFKEKDSLFSTHCIVIYTNEQFGYFLIGGEDENNNYQFINGNIVRKKSMNVCRSFMSCVFLNNNKILAIGGYNYKDNNQLTSIEEYDIETNTWESGKYNDLNIPRSQASSILFNENTIYVFGGYNKTDFSLDTIEMIDLTTFKTTLLEATLPLPIRRCGLLKISQNNILLLGGKTTAGNNLCNVFCFNTDHKIFTVFKNLSKPGIIEHELILDETGQVHIFLENNYGNSPPTHITYYYLDFK